MNVFEQLPDSVKVASATTPTVLTFMGIPVEQWMIIASIAVSIMIVIEKMPIVIKRIKEFYAWMREVVRRFRA